MGKDFTLKEVSVHVHLFASVWLWTIHVFT